MAVDNDVAVKNFEKDAKNRPVSKVIGLLKDMVNQLEKEGEEDEEVYETMGCWCVTNEKAKTKSIAEAESEIEVLTSSIESLTARSAQLNTEISTLEKEIQKETEALDTATSMREKESAEFTAQEKDAVVTISQLKAGLQALSQAHGASLLKKKAVVHKPKGNPKTFVGQFQNIDHFKEIEEEAMKNDAHIHEMLNNHVPEFIAAYMQVTHKSVEPAQRRQMTAFMQGSNAGDGSKHPRRYRAPELPPYIRAVLGKVLDGVDSELLDTSADDSDASNTGYEPASGEILGILKQMKESFESNLAHAQHAEAQAGDEFDQLKAAKETQIKTSTNLVDTKMGELARTDEKNANDKEIKDDTEASLAADQAFLADLKERCASMDAEFAERTKGRQLEIEAVSKALAFLNSDEAHDLFTRTFNPVLLQVSFKDERRLAVAKMLKKTGLKVKDAKLLKLATDLTKAAFLKAGDNAAFDKVKEDVNLLIDKLKKEQNDEMKKRDYCIDALNTNMRDMGMKERDKEDLIALIDDLKTTIDTLEKEIEVLKAEIAELQVQLKRASQNREKENAEFKTTVADQRATQKLLKVSLKILSDFYNAALVQKHTDQKGQKTATGQAPPPGFRSYEKSASSGGVMGMMQGIIDDAKAMEEECIRAEEKAQRDYEDYTKETTDSIDAKTNAIETKTSDKAQAEADLVQAKKDLESTLTELEALINEEADLHKECDFLIKNFELSQAARSEEMETLKQANQIFSGASFQLFLQGYQQVGNNGDQQ
jgi:chaperonin cofactor prefoldin